LLTGKATTLVLGGGGARGFAHIGVLKALQETGRIEIDALGGSSIGSIVAAQIAMGWSLDEITERNRKAFAQNKALHDLTLPLVSLLKGRHGDRILEDFFGDTLIEDLTHDFFCVSTNLTRGSVVIHRRGELLSSIRASISVPGILPPVFSAGDILVDGGVLNNLPVDVMQGLHQSDVIAVDVSPVEDLSTGPDFKQCPAPWEILWQQIKPGASAHKVPKIFDILMRSATIASTRAAQKMSREVSLFLHPPTEAFGMTEWNAFDHLVELGYESSKAPIEDWLRDRDAQGDDTPASTT
jgi:predicted acylesterase/phospholipase RssA